MEASPPDVAVTSESLYIEWDLFRIFLGISHFHDASICFKLSRHAYENDFLFA